MVDPLRIPSASACIHCGLCLSACPTYLETGNENDSPRGRIHLMRALQDRRLDLDPTTVRHIDLCLGCRACETACPSGVPYGSLIETTRAHVATHHRRPPLEQALRRWFIEGLFPHPDRLRWALAPARLLQRADATHLLPTLLREPLELLPPPQAESTLPLRSPASSTAPRRGTLGLLSGCVMQVLFNSTNANCIRLLNAAGWDVVVPPHQDCCGALFAHGGQLEAARARARTNIAAFESFGLDGILIGAAGCGSTLKEYGHLLEGDPAWADRARAFATQVKDLTEWLTESTPLTGIPPDSNAPAPPTPSADAAATTAAPGRVTFHDACHLAHAQRVTQPPRRLVQNIAGKSFVELPEADVCCGSAGSYNLTEPDMARRLQRRKIENILRTGATTVVTTNPGCLLQIQAGLRTAHAHHIRALHIADYLIESALHQEAMGGGVTPSKAETGR